MHGARSVVPKQHRIARAPRTCPPRSRCRVARHPRVTVDWARGGGRSQRSIMPCGLLWRDRHRPLFRMPGVPGSGERRLGGTIAKQQIIVVWWASRSAPATRLGVCWCACGPASPPCAGEAWSPGRTTLPGEVRGRPTPAMPRRPGPQGGCAPPAQRGERGEPAQKRHARAGCGAAGARKSTASRYPRRFRSRLSRIAAQSV